jgi:hypothetical protein
VHRMSGKERQGGEIQCVGSLSYQIGAGSLYWLYGGGGGSCRLCIVPRGSPEWVQFCTSEPTSWSLGLPLTVLNRADLEREG